MSQMAKRREARLRENMLEKKRWEYAVHERNGGCYNGGLTSDDKERKIRKE